MSDLSSEDLAALFEGSEFRPVVRSADLPDSVTSHLVTAAERDGPKDGRPLAVSDVLQDPGEAAHNRGLHASDGASRLLFGGISDRAAFVYSRAASDVERVDVYALRDGKAAPVQLPHNVLHKPSELIKALLRWGVPGLRVIGWWDEYDRVFTDTGFEPIFSFSDMPTRLYDYLMDTARRNWGYRRYSMPTKLERFFSDFDQPVPRKITHSRYRLSLGGAAETGAFLSVSHHHAWTRIGAVWLIDLSGAMPMQAHPSSRGSEERIVEQFVTALKDSRDLDQFVGEEPPWPFGKPAKHFSTG